LNVLNTSKSIAVQAFTGNSSVKVKESPSVKVKVFQDLDKIPGTARPFCQVMGQNPDKSGETRRRRGFFPG
jgi:hypothetical protein